MDSYSFFEEILGIDLGEAEKKEEKKAAKKQGAKKAEAKKAKKPAEKKVEKFVFPLTVLTGVCPPTVLTQEQAGEATTAEKIADIICEQAKIPRKIVLVKKLSESKIAVVLDLAKIQAKGEFDITPLSVAVIGEEEIALGEIEGKRTSDEINDFIAKQVGEKVPYRFIVDGSRLFAVPGENVAIGKVSLPVTIRSPLGNTGDIVFQATDLGLVGASEVEVDEVKEKLLEREDFKELEPVLELARPSTPQDTNILYVTLKRLVADFSKSTAPTKEMFPTTAVISMIFHRIPLSPDMFGGREEVEAKDIIELLSKDYPEYTESKTKLSYDKEGNFIFPTLKSSTKGAEFFSSREECLVASEAHPTYFLCNYKENGTDVRYEKTPVSVTEASADGKVGRFQWNLPKIPKKILEVIQDFFSFVTEDYRTEALVKLFYIPSEERYVVTVPQQTVSRVSVRVDYMEQAFMPVSDCYFVMDIHSHNIMPAFFSSVDDEDEKGNGVYGVMGLFNRNREKPAMLFRAATGGRFVSLEVDDIFEDVEVDNDVIPLSTELYREWDRVAEFE